MAERKYFRTTFRGFSKEDVLTHIDTLRAQQQEELKGMQEQLELAQQQSAAARAEVHGGGAADHREEARRVRGTQSRRG